MELNLNHPYETGLEQVLGIFLTEDHILGKNARLGARNVSIRELVRDEGSAKLVFEREMQSSNEVPGILASFHREWNRIRQEEHWVCKDEGEWHCEFRVHIEGVPAKIKGTMRLYGDSAACSNSITLDVRCEIPLLGKKIARFLLDDSRIKIGQEYQATLAML